MPSQSWIDQSWIDGPSTLTRGETPYHEYKCGCRASVLGMQRCPMHKAAPEMVECLRNALRWLDAADRFRYPNGYTQGESVQSVRDAARALLAHLDGEGE
jgi:hypothetical protein